MIARAVWAGKTVVFLVGLAMILAIVFGVASTALGRNGQALILGKATNAATKVTGLVGRVASGEALVVKNPSGGGALRLSVGDPLADPAAKTVAPMKVDSQARVANLNADKLDGESSEEFATSTHDHDGAYVNETDHNKDAHDALDLDADTVDGKDSSAFARSTGDGTGKAADSDSLDGKDFGDFSAATVLHEKVGPLPVEGTYTSKGGQLLILISGSGYRDTNTHGFMGMRLSVPGYVTHLQKVYTNEKNSRKAFVDHIAYPNVPAGQITIRLDARYDSRCGTAQENEHVVCTTTDDMDRFQVTVLEIPK